jgi:hypothetical protein
MTGTSTMVFQPANENVKANADPADQESSIADCIARLVHSIERIDNPDRAAPIDRSVDQWEDDDFVYLETDASSNNYLDIDINIHSGRIYIRLQK